MGIIDSFDIHLRRWKRIDNYASRKRLFITIILVLVIILYIFPLLFRKITSFSPSSFGDSNINCVEQHLRPFINDKLQLNLDIYKSYEESPSHFVPYIGNGKFSLDLDSDNSFNIMGRRSLDIPMPFQPIVQLDWFDAPSKSATVMNFKEGIVNKITCFDYVKKSASVKQIFYAHRVIPSLLVQEIKITNPTDVPLIIRLKRTGWTGKHETKSQIIAQQKDQTTYTLLVSHFEIPQTIGFGDREQFVGVAIAVAQIPDSIEINSHSQKTLTIRTFINYTSPVNLNQISAKVPELKIQIRETIKKVSELSSVALERYHIDSWNNLWGSGFGISYSLAPGALNGDVINATIYYVLCQRLAFPSNNFFNLNEFKYSSSKTLQFDSCYTGHSTLQAPTLWSRLDSLSDVNRITSLWILTLEKQGCHDLVKSSAEGAMQAMILSMASLEFTKHHLEFNTHPKELHRDYFIRRIHFGNDTLINITVALNDDNKAEIFVSIDKLSGNNKEFYACDGGCLDAPVKLGPNQIAFPVKLTEPLTSILYIASDQQHIEELKHTIHVKEVAEAPAHEHQTLVLHRYGHSLGGLPAVFWIIIIFLIVIFHLFLGKLIYNEYCGGSSYVQYERHRQGRYAM